MKENKTPHFIVVGNPHVGHDIAIYLAQHNIPFIDIKDMKPDGDKPEKVLVIDGETKLSDLIRVIEMEANNRPIIIEALPRFEEPIIIGDIYDNKPFYHNLGKKGGRKTKRFGR
jgi:hypothetical protein